MAVRVLQPRVLLDDPHACTDSSDLLPVFGAVFDTLVTRAPAGWQPALATRWSMSEDARTTTFTLREGVRFHDGSVCDAAAVRFNLERMARPDMGATLGAGGVYAQYLTGMRIETPDARTVVVTTAQPLADLLDIVGYGHVASPTALAGAEADLTKRMVGTGPLVFERFEAGREVCLRTDGGDERITLLQEADGEARLSAILRGEAEIAVGLPVAAAQRHSDEAVRVDTALMPTAIILMFQCERGPGADPRVRRALNLATDRVAIVRDVLGGLGRPLHGYISVAHDGYDPGGLRWPHDLPHARRLLREAGFGSGLHLELTCPTRLPDETPRLLDALEQQWAAVGVTFTRHVEPDRVAYANQVRTKQIRDICVFDSSPMSAFRVLHEKIDSRVRGSWWEGYRNPSVEALIDRGRATAEFQQRMAIYREAYRLLQEDPPWVTLHTHHRLVGFAGQGQRMRMRRDGILDLRGVAPTSPGL